MSRRRDFIKGVGAAALGLSGLPAAGVGLAPQQRDGVDRRWPPAGLVPVPPRRVAVTLFFDLSQLAGVDTTHYLYVAGRRYTLVATSDAPHVLAGTRRLNAFLGAMPDQCVTHHVEGVATPTDIIGLGYLTCNEDPASGSWEMTSMHFNIPQSAARYAYAQARAETPSGPLPLSARRKRYGIRPAMTAQDLADEFVFLNPDSQAQALVGLHPDILSIEPDSGAHILSNYVDRDAFTIALSDRLAAMGPAAPAGTANATGKAPWATLTTLLDDSGQPFKKSDGKLNQYYPDWSPEVEQGAALALRNVHPRVIDDVSLGVDVTAYNLNDPADQPPPSQLTGVKWARHDGIATELRTMDAVAGDNPTVVFTNKSPETGLYVSQPEISTLADGRVQVTLDNVSNWFLRYLGMWVQFLDPNGVVIPLGQVESDTFPAEPGPYPRSGTLDKSDAIFLGVVSPAVTVMGIPCYPGQFSPTLKLPKGAQTMRILYSGLGQAGSIPQDPANIIGVGVGMTAAFNYGVVGLFMAAGVSTISPVMKLVVSIGGGTVATAVMGLIGGLINQANFGIGMLHFAMGFVKILWQTGGSKALTEIATLIAGELVASEAIDSVPVAGQIARAVAAAVGAIQLAETSIECGLSPAVYEFDITQTHNLSVTFLPDKKNSSFPQPPAGYALFYRLSYLFDSGTATTLTDVPVPDPSVKSIPVTIAGIPRGGMVNVSLGMYMRNQSTPTGLSEWCAAKATTGLADNNQDSLPDLAISEIQVPIQATTRYLHTRKTTLDASGKHKWVATATAPPYVPPPDGQQPSLGDFRAITVRQGTSVPLQQGYVGYAWKALSSSVDGCNGGASGQFDQLANLNTDDGNGGANAQMGYTNNASLCGFQPGVRVGYDLLGHNARNIYLDSATLTLRQVNLDPPAFTSPASGQSFGVLNFDSTRCLLHPAGHVVSISQSTHKIELLKLPTAPVSDSDAQSYHLARTVSGFGTRPGLIQSPAALAIAADGAILVLEQDNNRIQAFDLGGNSVPHFTQQPDPHFLALDATAGATYLDMAVEFAGYIYVLSMDATANHRLDIYHPAQKGTAPICTTMGVNAANITVDFWRSVYSLNYEVLALPNGAIPGFTEPSVSLWLPTPPA